MTKPRIHLWWGAVATWLVAAAACSGGDGGGDGDGDGGDLGFFVTSAGNGASAGDYGGLAGADARCQQLADAAGAGDRTWRAYLSTSPDGPGEVVDARDRIGPGPWHNALGDRVAADVDALHDSGIDDALMRDETGAAIPRTEHDLLTGSGADGRVTTLDSGGMATCQNWTSNANDDFGWVGHTDSGPGAWNDAHETRCSETGMIGVNGTGRLMCFAAD